ncbi:hypothetical protein ACVWWP_007046 [Bradyrhizobium sp. LM3.6]
MYVGVMRRNHLFAAASICLALIVYATLARLAGRPALMGHHEAYWVVVIERFSAYGLLGFLLSFLLPGPIRFGLLSGHHGRHGAGALASVHTRPGSRLP